MERFRKAKQILKKSFSKLILSICVISCCLTIVPYKLIPDKTAVVHADGTPDTYIKNYVGSLIMTYLANMGLTIHSTVNDLGSFVYDLYDTFFRSYSGVLALGELMNEVEYDPDTETVSMKSAGYNSISSFADYLIHENNITSDSVDIIIGNYSSNQYTILPNNNPFILFGYGTARMYYNFSDPVRSVYLGYKDGNYNYFAFLFCYTDSFSFGWNSSQNVNPSGNSSKTINVNGITYYFNYTRGRMNTEIVDTYMNMINDSTFTNSSGDNIFGPLAVKYCYGDAAVLDDNIFVNGDASLDDRIGDISNNETADITLKDIIALLEEADLLDTSYPDADTNEDILKQILTAIQEYADDDDWADALDTTDIIEDPNFKIDPSKIPIPNILDPNAIPLLYEPECETLTACLIQGAQTVSDQLTSFSMLDQNYRKYIVVSVGVAFSLFVMGVWA